MNGKRHRKGKLKMDDGGKSFSRTFSTLHSKLMEGWFEIPNIFNIVNFFVSADRCECWKTPQSYYHKFNAPINSISN